MLSSLSVLWVSPEDPAQMSEKSYSFKFKRCLALMRLRREALEESSPLKASTALLALKLCDTPSVPLLKKDLGN